MNVHFLPQEGGHPLQATPGYTETVFGAGSQAVSFFMSGAVQGLD